MTKPQNGTPKLATPHKQRTFSQDEKDITAYFFFRLSVIYQAEFYRQMPSKEAEANAKRDNCLDVGKYSREQVNKAIEWIKAQKADGGSWAFLDLAKCVGALKQANTKKACHKITHTAKSLPLLRADKNAQSVIDARQLLKDLKL